MSGRGALREETSAGAEGLDDWVRAYREARRIGNAGALAELFTPRARYRTAASPDPVQGGDRIGEHVTRLEEGWQTVDCSIDVLAVGEEQAVVRWRSRLHREVAATVEVDGVGQIPLRGGGQAEVRVDGLYLVRLGAGGRCWELVEWEHRWRVPVSCGS